MSKDKNNLNFNGLLEGVKTLDDFETVMSSLYKQGIQHLLDSEMSHFLGYDKHKKKDLDTSNSRNGYYPKTLNTSEGKVVVDIPRDRKGEFIPQVVPKGQTTTQKIEQVITGLYARGMTTSDITEQIKDIYGLDVSKSFISDITTKMTVHIEAWQSRPLEALYCLMWMDCIRVKVRQDNRIINKSVYIVIGLNESGHKDVLGLWIQDTESAAFWLNVLNDLKARGVERVLIACTDNLTGFTDAIEASFPSTICQLCLVHQIRNSIKFVPWKDRKAFLKDLKLVYGAINLKQAKLAFEEFKGKWRSKYAYAIGSWEKNWDYLTSFFEFPVELRKIMYTTNTIEGLNRAIRKYTKTKSIYPNDRAAIKSIFLAIEQIQKKWSMPIRHWNLLV
ncbi:MAG: IS256 family transposase, partial [Symploca sp. SIO1C2]|nr:IS256 family transposase [Symploca sp. SIO1C2]